MYRVHFTITVDHPERRDSSFRPVPKGSKSALVWDYSTQRAAVAMFESMLRGEEDFSSEFISRVALYADRGGGVRCVRREIRRERPLRVRMFPGCELRRIAPSAVCHA